MITRIENTQNKLRKGLNTAADIITSTMGGSGSTVIINENNKLRITKDGVSVARCIQLEDPHENIGAQLLISAANETVKECGDGTTLTSLLLQQMVNSVTTIEDYKILEKETKLLHEYITKHTKEIKTIEEIKNIAHTATNDSKVSDLFEQIYSQTSFQTHIELERTEEQETTITIDKGYKFNEGFNKNYQMTNTSKQCIKYDNPNFYLSDKPLHTVTKRVEEAVSLAIAHDVPLVFIADKYSKEFDRFIQFQKMHSGAKLVTLKIPSYGEGKFHELENIKAYLNNNTANSIYCTPYYTLLNADPSDELKQRIKQLKDLSESVEDPLEANNYKRMYYRLSGNIATIWVGGKTKESRDELYDRIEDAVGATKTAIEHGYVLGMGKCFVNFTQYATSNIKKKKEFMSVWISPMDKIITNSGIKHPGHEGFWGDKGFDLQTGNPIDLLEKGIIDPAHSLHTALNNALANTKLVLNTKYILHNEL